jgi:predicted MFS family arabinose efflux permease
MNKYLRSLLIIDFFGTLSVGMIIPIYAIFVEKIGGDILDASGTWAVFAMASGILMYLIGNWEDKNKHYAKMMSFGYLISGFCFLGYLFVETTMHLFILQMFLGIGVAIVAPSYDTLYSKYLKKGRYATQWSLWEAENMIVTAIAAIVGGLVVTYFGFEYLFILMAISSFVSFIISYLFLKK